MLISPALDESPVPKDGAEAANTAQGRLAITNTAYDCLSNFDKFRDFQSRLAAGDSYLPDLDSLLATLGEANVKPVAARVLAKRQAQLQEKMDRIVVLATESVQTAGHDQALKLTQGKLPDADQFYDSVYKAARDAGNRTCVEEMSQLANSKLEVDETFKSELDSLVIDQAEMIAHKEYDRLEDKAASSAPTRAMPRFVALTLSLIIMGLVIVVCFGGATSPPTSIPASQYAVPPTNNALSPVTAPSSSTMPAAPAAGIANSVFNRSLFGPANSQVTGQAAPATQANNGAAPVAVPAPVLHPVSDAEVKDAEVAVAVVAAGQGNAPPPVDAASAAFVSNAGAAGLAGYGSAGTKAGGTQYASGIDAAMKGLYAESLRNFTESYIAGRSKEALYNEAVVLALQGQFQLSLQGYDQVLSLSPSFPQALYNRALDHQLLARAAGQSKNIGEWRKQLTMAIKNYTLAVKVEPRMSQAFYNRGLAYHDLGQMEKASADFTKANEQPVFMQAAAYNRDLIDVSLKKRTDAPATSPPPAPVGPVGPPGPA
jgi:tetratricopeptide (TPR) repeat protein